MEFGTLSYAVEGAIPRMITLRPGVTTLGRAPENDIVLDAEGVSAYHTRVLCTADDSWVMDLGSEEGTFLNHVRLRPNARYPLRDGDILFIGPFFVRYSQPNQPTDEITGLLKGIVKEGAGRKRPQVLPPEVAGRLSQVGGPPTRATARASARRLRGNAPLVKGVLSLRPRESASSYLQYLPPVYQDHDFLGRFLLIFETIMEPLERVVDEIHYYFDPRTAPEGMLPWLASWVDLVLNEKWPLGRRRALVRAAAELYRWRGTRRGLSEYIRIYTGIEPTIEEPELDLQTNGTRGLPANVFRVILEVPDPEAIDRRLVQAIIEAEKPANAGYMLDIRRKA
jgi:phage tail-like protein